MMRIFLISWTLLFTRHQAHAYFLPEWFVVEKAANAKKEIKTLRMRSKVFNGDTEFKEILWFDVAQNRVRGRILDRNDHEVYTYAKVLRPETDLSLISLVSAKPGLWFRTLNAYGIKIAPKGDTTTVEEKRLDRLDKTAVFVYGKDRASIWIDKDLFQTRLIEYANSAGPMKVYFSDYRPYRGADLPRKIEVKRNNDLLLSSEILDVAINSDASEISKTAIADGVPALPGELEANLRGLLQTWIEWVR